MVRPTDPNLNADPDLLAQTDIKVSGRSDLYIASNQTPGTLYYFGMQMDDTPLSFREYYNDVPADSHGGPQGPPIERQVLGRVATINFSLSVWSQNVRYWLENHNGAYETNGYIDDTEVGTLLFTNHAFRLLIVPLKGDPMIDVPLTASDLFFTKNFPTAVLSSPIEYGIGTKFSALRFTLEAHRSPPASPKRGILWDRDTTGYPPAVQQRVQFNRDVFEKAKEAAGV